MAAATTFLSLTQEVDDMARRRFQQSGDLFEQGGWWKLRWREDKLQADGTIKRGWSTPVVVGPGPGNQTMKALTQREAKRKAWADYLSRLDQNNHTPKSVATFAYFVEKKYEPEHISALAHQTAKTNSGILKNHILPILGPQQLGQIRRDHCQDVIEAAKKKGLSSQTIAHVRNIMSSVFRLAEDCEWNVGNPARRTKLPSVVHKQRHALTMQQVDAICREIPQYADLIMFLALTGLRIGEACGLRWKRINLTDKEGDVPSFSFAICEQFTNGQWKISTKTRKDRVIPLTTATYTLLDDIRKRTQFSGPDHTVFCNRGGGPLDAHNITNRHLKTAGRKVGIPEFSFHWLRHTAASLSDQGGMSLNERMALLGHSSSRVASTYVHADREKLRAKLEKVN